MKRVVSLIASSTEIVCALGLERSLVGRSHECDYPTSVKKLPVCTAPKFQTDGRSYEIDQRVKAILQEGLSVYLVDAEKLKTLEPEVILTQSQCEVCAVSLRDVEEAVCQWQGSSPQVVSLAPNALGDVWGDIVKVARALDATERGEALVKELKGRMEALAGSAALLETKPTVACIEWIRPLMASGNWMPELVTMAAGSNLFGEAGEHAPWLSWERLRSRDPEVILVLPCGFDLERTRQEMPELAGLTGWQDLRAVEAKQVYLLDGNQYFNRPGPRLVESLEILAEILHPDVFHFGHEGEGWERFVG